MHQLHHLIVVLHVHVVTNMPYELLLNTVVLLDSANDFHICRTIQISPRLEVDKDVLLIRSLHCRLLPTARHHSAHKMHRFSDVVWKRCFVHARGGGESKLRGIAWQASAPVGEDQTYSVSSSQSNNA